MRNFIYIIVCVLCILSCQSKTPQVSKLNTYEVHMKNGKTYIVKALFPSEEKQHNKLLFKVGNFPTDVVAGFNFYDVECYGLKNNTVENIE